jgi:hypothetical protein
MPHYKNNEIEVKYKITKKQFKNCIDLLKELFFTKTKSSELIDFFLEIKKTDLGWNFIRLRQDETKFIKTIKSWENINGVKCRMEKETTINKNNFNKLKNVSKISYKKLRRENKGKIEDMNVIICFDIIDNDIFIEVETSGKTTETKKIMSKLKKFLKEKLNVNTNNQAPTMLDYVLNKQM